MNEYNGVYYWFEPRTESMSCDGVWHLSESIDNMKGASGTYNAEIYRLDECFEQFKLLQNDN